MLHTAAGVSYHATVNAKKPRGNGSDPPSSSATSNAPHIKHIVGLYIAFVSRWRDTTVAKLQR